MERLLSLAQAGCTCSRHYGHCTESRDYSDYLQPHPSSEDIVIVQENEYCQSERMTIFIGVIYAYKGLLLVSNA